MNRTHVKDHASGPSPLALCAFFVTHSCAIQLVAVWGAASRCAVHLRPHQVKFLHIACHLLLQSRLWLLLLVVPILITIAGAAQTVRTRDSRFVEIAFLIGGVVGIVVPVRFYVGD